MSYFSGIYAHGDKQLGRMLSGEQKLFKVKNFSGSQFILKVIMCSSHKPFTMFTSILPDLILRILQYDHRLFFKLRMQLHPWKKISINIPSNLFVMMGKSNNLFLRKDIMQVKIVFTNQLKGIAAD